MSLLSLRKSQPLAKPTLRSVDDFIEDALHYAQGVDKKPVRDSHEDRASKAIEDRVVHLHKVQKSRAMRHATFTLTPECILKLTQLSKQKGKAKSALIREWIQQNAQ